MARMSKGRLEKMMTTFGVDDAVSTYRLSGNKPQISGIYQDVGRKDNPQARWRQKVWKHELEPSAGDIRLTFSGAIDATGRVITEVKAIALWLSSSLTGAFFVNKIGVVAGDTTTFSPATGAIAHDASYFYTGSVTHYLGRGQYVSGANAKIIAAPGRAGAAEGYPGAPPFSGSHLLNGGYFTSSADITVTLSGNVGVAGAQNPVPIHGVGKVFLYVYADTYYAPW